MSFLAPIKADLNATPHYIAMGTWHIFNAGKPLYRDPIHVVEGFFLTIGKQTTNYAK